MKWTLPVLIAACLLPATGLRGLIGHPTGELLAFGARGARHHAIGEIYDEERTVILDGEVEAFLFGNPHSLLHVRVIDGRGRTRTWAVEWRAADRLSRAGLRGDALAQGDAVTLCGHPGRDPGAFRLYLLNVAQQPTGPEAVSGTRAELCERETSPEIGTISRR